MPDTQGSGDVFFQDTCYLRGKPFMQDTGIPRPPFYKKYEQCRKVELPPPLESAPVATLHDAIRLRKSVRRYSSKPVTAEQVSYLLWATQGINRKEGKYEFRTAPSAGALYPLETYLVINNCSSIEKGIYHYNIQEHCLEELKPGDSSLITARSAMDQKMCAEAPLVFIWASIFDRCKFRYGQRAYRYIHLDAGHTAQNLALTAVAMGMATCQIAAYLDNEVNALIDVDGKREAVVYMSVVGYAG